MLLSPVKKILGNDVFYNQVVGDLEAIHFQVNSGFPRELEAIFDKAFEFVKKYDEAYDEVSSSSKAAVKYEKFKVFFEKELNPLIINTVKKYTGMSVKGIDVLTPHDFKGVFGFSVYTSTSDSHHSAELANLHRLKSGRSNIQPSISEFVDDLFKMSTSLNKSTGIVNDKSILYLRIVIPLGLFSIHDFTKSLTIDSKEITATFLHEVGHVISNLEYISDLSYVGYYGNNLLREVISDNVKRDMKGSIKDSISLINKYSSHVKDKDVINKLSITANKILEYVSSDVDAKDGYERDSDILFKIVVFIISVIMVKLFIAFLLITPGNIFDIISDFEKFDSRDIITSKNKTSSERLADEYVSRFGMGKYLNSFLEKSRKLRKELGNENKPNFDKYLKESQSYSLFTSFISIPGNLFNYLFNIKADGTNGNHENLVMRLKRNINNLHDVIKGNLPDDIKRKLMDDIDSMEYQLKLVKNDVSFNAFEKGMKFVMNIIPNVATSIYRIFSKNNPYKEYELVFEYIDDMLSNKSHYYSERVKHLFR